MWIWLGFQFASNFQRLYTKPCLESGSTFTHAFMALLSNAHLTVKYYSINMENSSRTDLFQVNFEVLSFSINVVNIVEYVVGHSAGHLNLKALYRFCLHSCPTAGSNEWLHHG